MSMILVFSVLFVISIVFCMGIVVYTVAVVLMRREAGYKPMYNVAMNKYYDYPFAKRNDAIFNEECHQSLHR